jgi:acetyl esterase/lipase
MPKRMPVDSLAEARRKHAENYLSKFPILSNVTTERVTRAGVEAVWYLPASADKSRAILYFHGGGFMWCSAMSHGGVISRIADRARFKTLALDYKVAPFSPFPGPVKEGVSLYRSMLASGYEPGNIAFVGDSAGGNLVLSVMLALKQEGTPLPACAAITSAYLDLTHSGESIEWVRMDPCVSREGLEICAGQYLQGHDPADPLASPIFGDVTGFPPTLVQVGSREQLMSDSLRFVAKAETAGLACKLEVYEGCTHLWHWWVPDAPESAAAVNSIAEFVRAHTR